VGSRATVIPVGAAVRPAHTASVRAVRAAALHPAAQKSKELEEEVMVLPNGRACFKPRRCRGACAVGETWWQSAASPPKLISHSPHNHSEVSRGKCFLSTHSLTTLSRGRCALHIPAPPPSSRRPQVRAHLASPKVIFPSLPPDTGRARESLYGIPPVTCPAVCRSGLSVLVKRSGQQGLGRARGRGAGLQPRHVVAAV
jgi:hypothetical protein